MANPRSRSILEYLEGLEREVPGLASLILVRTHSPLTQAAISVLQVHWLEQQYLRGKGERKAQALKGFVYHLTEHFHQRLLIPLDLAERIRRGRAIDDGATYGQIVGNLRRWAPALGDFIPEDAAHWRNSAVHLDGWTHSKDFQLVHLRDRNPWTREIVWKDDLSPEQVHARLRRLWDATGNYLLCLMQVVAESACTFSAKVPVIDWMVKEVGVDTGRCPTNQEMEAAFTTHLATLIQRVEASRAPVDTRAAGSTA